MTLRRSFGAAGLIALLLAGCGGDDAPQDAETQAPTETGSTPILDDSHPYVLLRDPAWNFQEAVDYGSDSPFATIESPPTTDWFVEYDHQPIEVGDVLIVDHVSIKGLDAPLDEAAARLARMGYVFEPSAAGPWTARGTLDSADREYATIVLLDGGQQTVMVLSYDMEVDALADLAAVLEPVDEATWVAAGGIIQ